MTTDFKIGDIVRKKGSDTLFRVRKVYEDGVIDVIEVTDDHDKRVYIRQYTEFELTT